MCGDYKFTLNENDCKTFFRVSQKARQVKIAVYVNFCDLSFFNRLIQLSNSRRNRRRVSQLSFMMDLTDSPFGNQFDSLRIMNRFRTTSIELNIMKYDGLKLGSSSLIYRCLKAICYKSIKLKLGTGATSLLFALKYNENSRRNHALIIDPSVLEFRSILPLWLIKTKKKNIF